MLHNHCLCQHGSFTATTTQGTLTDTPTKKAIFAGLQHQLDGTQWLLVQVLQHLRTRRPVAHAPGNCVPPMVQCPPFRQRQRHHARLGPSRHRTPQRRRCRRCRSGRCCCAALRLAWPHAGCCGWVPQQPAPQLLLRTSGACTPASSRSTGRRRARALLQCSAAGPGAGCGSAAPSAAACSPSAPHAARPGPAGCLAWFEASRVPGGPPVLVGKHRRPTAALAAQVV
jgi:hypothetical protein